MYCQLVKRRYSEERQAPGSDPVFDVQLKDNERIVGVFHQWTVESERRKTVDHHIILWVECRFPAVS